LAGLIRGYLKLPDGKNVIQSDTHYVKEHNERNIFVKCYINDNESIENVTNRSKAIDVWPPVDGSVNQVSNLPFSEIVSVLQIIL